jgi:hypothetical protein
MEQHPIPRQITTFEFKLIGFMTIKQFIYLIVFVGLGFVVYFLFPIPIINILLAVGVGSIGAALAFVPYNDRPLDHWLATLLKKINSPTQYFYRKQNKPLYFLESLYFISDPHLALTHIESQEKLNSYLNLKKPAAPSSGQLNKQQITQLFNQPTKNKSIPQKENKTTPSPSTTDTNQPFIYGSVRSNKLFPLPDILIYVKDKQGRLVRLLKTNTKGYFASYKLLPPGEYIFEPKDPKQNHFFDTMNFRLEENNPNPIEIFSKKIL